MRYARYAAEMLPALVLPICPNRSAVRQLRAGACVARLYRHFPDCPKLLADWQMLAQTAGATAFQSPPWQRAISRFADSIGSLRLIVVYRNDTLIGVMLLEACFGRQWRAPGRMTTDYLEPLLDPAHADEALGAMMQLISQAGVRSVTIEPTSPGARCLAALPAVAADHGFAASIEPASTATMIPLPPTWETYLAGLSSHGRKELRRKIRKADEKGAARILVADTPLAAGHALDDVLNLMQNAGGPKGRKVRWLFRQHFVAAADLVNSGRLIVYQLHVEQRLAAGLIALRNGDHLILWCGAIDRALSEWSPGIVLFAKVFEQAIARGETQIDLLRGQYAYKYSFGAIDRDLQKITLTRSG